MVDVGLYQKKDLRHEHARWSFGLPHVYFHQVLVTYLTIKVNHIYIHLQFSRFLACSLRYCTVFMCVIYI
jgi:hypothetical protein